MTQRALRSWPVVMTASPTLTGPWRTASFSTASPPARLMAAATPWSIHSSVEAGATTASTSSWVMSPLAISSLVLPTDVFMCPPLCAGRRDTFVAGSIPAGGRLRGGQRPQRSPGGSSHERLRSLDRRRLRHDRAVGAGRGRQQEDPRVRDPGRGQLLHPPGRHRRAAGDHRAAHRVRPLGQRVRHQRRGRRLDSPGGRRHLGRGLQRVLLRPARRAGRGDRADHEHRPRVDGALRLAHRGRRVRGRDLGRHGGHDGGRGAHLALDGRGRRRAGGGADRRGRRWRAPPTARCSPTSPPPATVPLRHPRPPLGAWLRAPPAARGLPVPGGAHRGRQGQAHRPGRAHRRRMGPRPRAHRAGRRGLRQGDGDHDAPQPGVRRAHARRAAAVAPAADSRRAR